MHSNVWLTLVLEVEFIPYFITKDSISTRREKKRERDKIFCAWRNPSFLFWWTVIFFSSFLFSHPISLRNDMIISIILHDIFLPLTYIILYLYPPIGLSFTREKKNAYNTRTYTEVESLEGGWRREGGGQFETAASACDWWSTSGGIVIENNRRVRGSSLAIRVVYNKSVVTCCYKFFTSCIVILE